ncbi:MAG: single-stranded DNA-binding protein [Patescibacteria group bacterium]
MSVRSLNKVMLIGNLTRDPNLRFTPNNTAVCSFGVATNRSWTSSDTGEKQEKTDFHNIVAWGKLAEICGNLLHKGDKVFVQGRIQTRDWKTQEGDDRRITEIVIDDMMILSSKFSGGSRRSEDPVVEEAVEDAPTQDDVKETKPKKSTKKSKAKKEDKKEDKAEEEVVEAEDVSDDIPF